MCFKWDNIPGIPARVSSFFLSVRASSTDFQGLQCLQVVALHFYYNNDNNYYYCESAVASQRSHPPFPAFALRTHKKSAGAAQIVSIKQIPEQKTKKQKEGKKKKNPPFFFFFLWRIWGRDLITTAGVCRHWNKNKKTQTHTHTEKKKNTRRQMNIQSEWQNMRENNWQMKRRRMCS